MVINTNIQALTASANLHESQSMLAKSLARLSSGSKITNPSDDAAGVAVASRLDSQIKRTEAAKTNVVNAISFTQTQDGYLKKVAKAFDRMSELSLLAQDVTKGDNDRALYDTEFQQLISYIENSSTKDFNGVSLFSTATLNVTLDSEGNTFAMGGIDLSGASYTDALVASVGTTAAALSALADVKSA
ncbi:MAG TPA: flagellin, partial [Verrucomicrobiae bacterium]|nr:flagellin [Verrucomicrobiae bacterium]